MQNNKSKAGTLSGVREIDVFEFAHAIMNGAANSEDLDARAREIYQHYSIDEDVLIRLVYPHLLIAAQFCQCRLPQQSEDEELLSIQLTEQDTALIVELLEEKGTETINAMQQSSGSLKHALQENLERIETALTQFD